MTFATMDLLCPKCFKVHHSGETCKEAMGSDRRERMKVDSARFFKLYPNIPLPLRSEAICVVNWKGNKEPISWHVAYMEIEGKTELGDRILEALAGMGVI